MKIVNTINKTIEKRVIFEGSIISSQMISPFKCWIKVDDGILIKLDNNCKLLNKTLFS